MLAHVVIILIQFVISYLQALLITFRLSIKRQSIYVSTAAPRRSRFFISFKTDVKKQHVTSAKESFSFL